jgi:TolB-like protein/class 3 adenylate cyclase
MTSKRKLTTILSADVFEYSRLMAEDDRATLETLKTYRDVIRAHVAARNGRVVDAPGDALLAEFASAVEAVDCGIDIQNELSDRNNALAGNRRMLFRFGIHLGDVIEEDGALYGDGVNIAARLESLADPGGICVSSAVREAVQGKIAASFQSLGERQIKNIPNPVRVYRVVPGPAASSVVSSRPKRARTLWLAVLIGLTVLAVASIATLRLAPVGVSPSGRTQANDRVLSMPTGPLVAVLPFTNMSGDPNEDYFSDGLTEDIITELSRFRDIHVLARNTTFQYKGQAVDIRAIGQKLGVQYVLEGSVRKTGDQVRVTAQLIDVASGSHLWAEKYDRSLAHIFAIQDEISSKIVATIIGGDLSVLKRAAISSASNKAPTNLGTYDLLLRAAVLDGYWSEDNYVKAKAYLEEALRREPDYARARQQYAYTLLIGWIGEFEKTPLPPKEVKDNAIRAVRLDPADPRGHRTAAMGYYFDKQLTRFDEEATKAIELAPNDAQMLAELGALFAFSGQWERGIALITKAKALNAEYAAGWYAPAMHYELYRNGKYRESLDVVKAHPEQQILHTQWKYVALYGELGDRQKAQEHWEQCKKLDPNWSTARMVEHLRLWNLPEPLISQYIESYAKAGYPLKKTGSS